MAKIILMDWQRGKIPYFVPPPLNEAQLEENENKKVY
jgi:ribosome biogenesis GTPase A